MCWHPVSGAVCRAFTVSGHKASWWMRCLWITFTLLKCADHIYTWEHRLKALICLHLQKTISHCIFCETQSFRINYLEQKAINEGWRALRQERGQIKGWRAALVSSEHCETDLVSGPSCMIPTGLLLSPDVAPAPDSCLQTRGWSLGRAPLIWTDVIRLDLTVLSRFLLQLELH